MLPGNRDSNMPARDFKASSNMCKEKGASVSWIQSRRGIKHTWQHHVILDLSAVSVKWVNCGILVCTTNLTMTHTVFNTEQPVKAWRRFGEAASNGSGKQKVRGEGRDFPTGCYVFTVQNQFG